MRPHFLLSVKMLHEKGISGTKKGKPAIAVVESLVLQNVQNVGSTVTVAESQCFFGTIFSVTAVRIKESGH